MSEDERNKYKRIISHNTLPQYIRSQSQEEEISSSEEYIYVKNNGNEINYQLSNIIYARNDQLFNKDDQYNILMGNKYKLQDDYKSNTDLQQYIKQEQYEILNETDRNKYQAIQAIDNYFLTSEEYAKLSKEEQKKYDLIINNKTLNQYEYNQLPAHLKILFNQQMIVNKHRIPIKGQMESITQQEAIELANQQLIYNKLQKVTDKQLLDYYNIEINDDVDDKTAAKIIKNIRRQKDLYGNKITDNMLQPWINLGLTREQAYIQYLQQNDFRKQISVKGDINPYALYNFDIDYSARSKNIKIPNILRSKKETNQANIKVEGYEKGKHVEFWTDEKGAQTFYQNQQILYAATNGYDIKKSALYEYKLGEKIKELEKQKQITDKNRAKAELEVLQQISELPEFNMNEDEILEFYGITVEDTALGRRAKSQIAHNLALGLSPNGKPWMEDIVAAEKLIHNMLEPTFKDINEQTKDLYDQVQDLKSRQLINENTIYRLAVQYTANTDKYGNIQIEDPNAVYQLEKLKFYDSLYDPNAKSVIQDYKSKDHLITNSYYGGLWGSFAPNN